MVETHEHPRRTRKWVAALCLASALLLLLSWASGPYVFIPLTFIVPVALMAWHVGRWEAITLGALLSVARYIMVLIVWEPSGFTTAVATINFAMLLGVLTGSAWYLDLAAQSHSLSRRINRLESLLSICSYCKRIHRKDGEWERLESYLSEHTDTQFSHGICPACAQEHFPEVFPKPTPGEDATRRNPIPPDVGQLDGGRSLRQRDIPTK